MQISATTTPRMPAQVPLKEAWNSPKGMPTRGTVLLLDRPDRGRFPSQGVGLGGWMVPFAARQDAIDAVMALRRQYREQMAIVEYHPHGVARPAAYAVAPLVSLDWTTNGSYGGHFEEFPLQHSGQYLDSLTRSGVRIIAVTVNDLVYTKPVRP
jgi:hypothetical protein